MHEQRPGVDPRVVDGLVTGVAATVAVFGAFVPLIVGVAGVRPIAVVLALGQAAPLWWRRRRPLAVLAVTLVVLLLAQGFGDVNAASFWGPHLAAYAAAAYSDRRRALLALAVVLGAGLLDVAVVRVFAADLEYTPVLLGPTGAAVLVGWGIGRYVQVRRAYLQAVLAYTHRLEHERDEELSRAVQQERRRIARDLHEVAHHLGVVSLQTSAARRWLDRDRHRTSEALGAAEAASRAALETMPAILQALRTDDGDAPRTPQPSLEQLDALVTEVRSAGMAVDIRIDGERRLLPVPVEVTAYRVVQEALTNVLRTLAVRRSPCGCTTGPTRWPSRSRTMVAAPRRAQREVLGWDWSGCASGWSSCTVSWTLGHVRAAGSGCEPASR